MYLYVPVINSSYCDFVWVIMDIDKVVGDYETTQ